MYNNSTVNRSCIVLIRKTCIALWRVELCTFLPAHDTIVLFCQPAVLLVKYDLILQVALVYPNNDPISFICAFYGCILAGVVPVPVEVTLLKRVGVAHVSGRSFPFNVSVCGITLGLRLWIQ
jgi:hypothetical protein